jgi:hypothetical protein
MTLAAAVLAAGGVTAVALGSGGAAPPPPADPPAFTVVAVGTAQRPVKAPARRTDATIDRAVRAALAAGIPGAVAAARREAEALAGAAALRAGRIVGIRRDVSQPPYFDGDEGRFGPGKWCGRIYSGRRTVERPDGTTRRVSRFRHGCQVPKTANVRVTATFAAELG